MINRSNMMEIIPDDISLEDIHAYVLFSQNSHHSSLHRAVKSVRGVTSIHYRDI